MLQDLNSSESRYVTTDIFDTDDTGLLIERWDITEPITPRSTWVNSGKFQGYLWLWPLRGDGWPPVVGLDDVADTGIRAVRWVEPVTTTDETFKIFFEHDELRLPGPNVI